MSRRLVGSMLVTTSLLAGATSSFGIDLLPSADCANSVPDPAEDAKVNYAPSPLITVPVQPNPSEPGLDITAVTLRTTSTTLEAYLKIKDIPKDTDMKDTETAYGYDVFFTIGTKGFRFQNVMGNPTFPKDTRPDASGPYPKGAGGTGTAYNANLQPVTGGVDPETNYVTAKVPRSAVDTVLGEPLANGTKITAISAKSFLYVGKGTGLLPFTGDVTSVAADVATYTVGDGSCFAPPAGVLSAFTATPATVQFGDATKLSATLVDSAGAKVAGQQVRFTVAGESALTGTTNADGVASVTYVPKQRGAGAYAVAVEFLGSDEVGKAETLTGKVTVKAETAKFNPLTVAKPSSTTRTVTATLLDDDKRAVVAQKVNWYVNGKKVATTSTTDSKGRAIYKTAKPGQTVQARYAGLAGKYSAANSNAPKV